MSYRLPIEKNLSKSSECDSDEELNNLKMSSATAQTQLMTTSVNIRKDLGANSIDAHNDNQLQMHNSQMMMSNNSMSASVYVEPEIYSNVDFKS